MPDTSNRVFAPKSKQFDELNGRWVRFPSGKQYLLPIISRQQEVLPVFHPDGSIGMEVRHFDAELGAMVEKYIALTMQKKGASLGLPTEAYADAMRLFRRLLSENYAFSSAQLIDILRMPLDQLGELFSVLLTHISSPTAE